MRSAHVIVRKSSCDTRRVVDTVMLDYEARRRRRIVLTSKSGIEFLLDLEKPLALHDGDALELENGDLIVVQSAPESLLAIRTENQLLFTKIAWHLGNRHTPVEITMDTLFIQEDHVLSEMVRGLGGHIVYVSRPFEPESGAYHSGHSHNHHGHKI